MQLELNTFLFLVFSSISLLHYQNCEKLVIDERKEDKELAMDKVK